MKIIKLLSLVLLLALPLASPAQFTFTTNSGVLTITAYTGPGGVVAIPATTNGYPVTSIGFQAFFNCTNLTSITIPNSVTSIGDAAFEVCLGLTNVTIPNSVTSIGGTAFFNSGLTSVTIPNSVTSIGDQAFACYSLTNIAVVAGNPDYSSVNGVLFDQAQATLIEYPGGLGGGYAIPYSVTNIGVTAFASCLGLTSVTIPNSVTSIGDVAFDNCYNLTNITVMAGNPDYSSVNGVLFDRAQATLIEYPGGLGGGYTIPDTVTALGEPAFADCYYLTSVTIPNSVTNIGDDGFDACTSLTNIAVVVGNPDYSSVNGVLFDQAQTTLIQFPGGLGGGYTIPNSVTTIAAGAFAFSPNLASVTIPNNVTNIGSVAFEDCLILTSAYFLGNAPPDDGTVFFGDSATVYYVAGTTGWGSTFGSVPTALWNPQEQFTFTTNSGVVTITGYTGSGGAVSIPVTINGLPVTSIGSYAFYNCNLTSVTIPNSVANIESMAFYYCSSLTSVTIPNSVTSIGDFAFNDCYSLTSAYFEGNAPPDDGYSFLGGNMATVYYLAGTTGWGSTFGSAPAVLWNPQAQAPSVTAGQFGFGITGPTNVTIVVEACTNLANPVWLPVATNTLDNTGTGTFSDPQTGTYPTRYYRFNSQ